MIGQTIDTNRSSRVDHTSRVLPDVSRTDEAAVDGCLEWVGMRGIQMPVDWLDELWPGPTPARLQLMVNLPSAGVKGIHMSRLYTLLHQTCRQPVTPASIAGLLGAAIASHAECASTAARLVLDSTLIRSSDALVTPQLHGWIGHEVNVEAVSEQQQCRIWLTLELVYSSTCPCSASLTRQLIEEQFRLDHRAEDTLSMEEVAQWIRRRGTLATPHSQRSIARVRVAIPVDGRWSMASLIALAENALGTPSQGPVKRADEQEFALRNGQNLMFVEDAARRLAAALGPRYRAGSIEVTHLESLHPHDAVASVSWGGHEP